MVDFSLGLMTGVDICVKELNLIIHQPTLKEISYFGEEGFFIAASTLCIQGEKYVPDKNISNFQVFLTIYFHEENKEIKDYVKVLLDMLFPLYKVLITPQSIIFEYNETKETILIDKDNFNSLQEVLSKILCINTISGRNEPTFNPIDAKAEKIAKKLMEGRKKVAAQKGGSDKDVLSRYISILTVGISSMSLNDCINLTLFQLLDLMQRLQLYINYENNLRLRLAGADIKEEIEDWMKNLYS